MTISVFSVFSVVNKSPLTSSAGDADVLGDVVVEGVHRLDEAAQAPGFFEGLAGVAVVDHGVERGAELLGELELEALVDDEAVEGDAVGLGDDGQVGGAIAARAVRMFPRLAGVRVVRQWGALRVMSPDGLPIYTQSEAHPGAMALSCHSGVTLAAAHAGEVAEAVLAETLAERYPAFSPRRFAEVPA